MPNVNGRIVLALDASSTAVGFCLAQGERYIDSGVFRPKGEPKARVALIVQWAKAMIDLHAPDVVAIEEPTGDHRNRKTDRLLARVCGAVEGACILTGIPAIYIHAMTVKQTGFNKHNLPAAARIAGKRSVKPDEADAVGVWQAAIGELQAYRIMNTSL